MGIIMQLIRPVALLAVPLLATVLLAVPVYPDSSGTRKNPLRISSAAILVLFMIRGGFLDPESRKDLIELAPDRAAAHAVGVATGLSGRRHRRSGKLRS